MTRKTKKTKQKRLAYSPSAHGLSIIVKLRNDIQQGLKSNTMTRKQLKAVLAYIQTLEDSFRAEEAQRMEAEESRDYYKNRYWEVSRY